MNLFYLTFLSIFTSFLSISIIYINRLLGNKYIDNIDGAQKFHTLPTPRLGGLAILGAFLLSLTFTGEHKATWVLIIISSIPLFLAGFMEDLIRNISPKVRLISGFFSGILFVILTGFSVKSIDIFYLDSLLSVYIGSLLFTSLAISGVSNSLNIIDGFHGLASGVLIILFSAFAIIAWKLEDQVIFNIAIISIFIFFGFFIINFPYGYIFLGDAGAYFGGFLLSVIAIMLPYRNPEVSSWVSFLICSYPIIETLFSIFRKIKRKGHHPSKPDSVHLHMLIYRHISRSISKKIGLESFRNPLTSLVIWLIPLSTSLMAVLAYKSLFFIIICILIVNIMYLITYRKVSLNWQTK